ncbi:hypothetical protein N658DRAFT_500607 [Parathielavia hyrcaniae]|uniref:Uncharacterized protein n=1 Tax=Parathielavia hyrcaniae TaxID=113614 RepID=A0AAN6PUH0_9PEZI|nr:hypothetical protein N658DRAFT_500607 [Parathielavia hyrcaniae]
MREKNAGKFGNRKIQPASRAAPRATDDTTPTMPETIIHRASDEGAEAGGWTIVTPRKIASELSLFGFGSDMQPYAPVLMHRALTVVKPAAYGLQGMAIEPPRDDNLFCFANFTHDPGILHSTLFSAQAFHDLALGYPYSKVAQVHLYKALRHLQKCLDDQRQAVELSTTAVVASLAMAAVIAGDLATAAKHMDGPQRILQLRGGLQSLQPGSMLEHKASVHTPGPQPALPTRP